MTANEFQSVQDVARLRGLQVQHVRGDVHADYLIVRGPTVTGGTEARLIGCNGLFEVALRDLNHMFFGEQT